MTMFEDTPDAPKKENPVAQFFRLRARAKAATSEIGYDLQQFVISPGVEPEGPHHVHAVFTMAEEKPPSIEDDKEFAAFLEGQEKAERERKAAEQREGLTELREQLKRPEDGIL